MSTKLLSATGLSFSAIFLFAANLLPLFGVLFYGWDVGLVLGLFWIENLIIGAFNLLKMLLLAIRNRAPNDFFLSAFFTFHYGFFCIGHGLFLWDLLDLGTLNFSLSPLGDAYSLLGEGVAVLFNIIQNHVPVIYLGLLALAASHLVRFIEHFIVRGGLLTAQSKKLMSRPYSQVLVMHAGLLVGGLLVEKFGSTIWLLTIIVLFKIVVDFVQMRHRHRIEHADMIKDF